MADKKISQLTAATTPLAGTEVLPIVQGGSTVKVSVDNLTAGKAVSASGLTLSGGTANCVTYLNASKAVTTTSNLSYNGTGLGIGVSSATGLLHLLSPASTNSDFTQETTSAGTASRTRYLRGGVVKFLAGLGAYTGGDTYEIASGTAVLTSLDSSGNLTASTGNVVIGTADKGLADSAGNLKLAVNTTSVAAQSVLSGGLTHRKGAYTPGATTPSAVGVSYFDISNSSATSITNFTGAVEGQMLLLVFRDANTTITRNNAYLAGSANFTSATNATLLLISDGTNWFEVCRSTTNG
jgi:hypothetical protein